MANNEPKNGKQSAGQALQTANADVISSLVLNGDVSKLSSDQKVLYYRQFCERIGLDPMSQPFKLLKLNGKEILYCDRSGAQQLNKIHSVSHEITNRETSSGCYIVTAKAFTPDGRQTECIGAVPITKEGGRWMQSDQGRNFFQGDGTVIQFTGDDLCNAMMKAETKAKRRATLDLLGLGILDDTEISSIPGAETVDAPHVVVNDQQQQQTTPAPPLSEFKTTYPDSKSLLAALAKVKTKQELVDLGTANDVNIQKHPNIKDQFTAKKHEVYGTKPDPYILKYEDPQKLMELLASAASTDQIMILHRNNSLIIERTPELFDKMNNRIASLKTKSK